jgi:hypothetical protein
MCEKWGKGRMEVQNIKFLLYWANIKYDGKAFRTHAGTEV